MQGLIMLLDKIQFLNDMFTTLVQNIYREPECKTQINGREIDEHNNVSCLGQIFVLLRRLSVDLRHESARL